MTKVGVDDVRFVFLTPYTTIRKHIGNPINKIQLRIKEFIICLAKTTTNAMLAKITDEEELEKINQE